MSCSEFVWPTTDVLSAARHLNSTSPVFPLLSAPMTWPWWVAASWAWPLPGSSSFGIRDSASSFWRRRRSWVGWATCCGSFCPGLMSTHCYYQALGFCTAKHLFLYVQFVFLTNVRPFFPHHFPTHQLCTRAATTAVWFTAAFTTRLAH